MKQSEFAAIVASLQSEIASLKQQVAARPAMERDTTIVVVDRLAPSESGKPRVRVRISNTGAKPIVVQPGTEHSFFANEFVRDISGGKRNGFYCRPMTDGVKPIGEQQGSPAAANAIAAATPAPAPVASDDDQKF
jgi:hypothetical protein